MLRDWFILQGETETNEQERTVSFLSIHSLFSFDPKKYQMHTVIFCELAACKILFAKIARSTYRLGLTWSTYRHFRPSQSLKWITVKWLNSWQTITRGGCVTGSLKTSFVRPILIYFELEARLHLLLSFEWTLTRLTNKLRQNIVFSYSEMIPVSFSLFLLSIYLSLSLFFGKLWF